MTIEELAKHYQDTGEYLEEAKLLEDEHIKKSMTDIKLTFIRYVNSYDYWSDDYSLTLEHFIRMEIGSWQAKHGFYRSLNGKD